MRTASGRQMGSALAKARMAISGPLWNRETQYDTGASVSFAGDTWVAMQPVGRGQYPQGSGDGSGVDRDILMSQRSGFAASVTGGYAGPTYLVNRNDDALDGAGNPACDSGGLSGTLRAALVGYANTLRGGNYWDPLWIVFDPALASGGVITISMTAGGVNTPVNPAPNKTIDGRGAAPVTILFPRNDSSPLEGINAQGVKNATGAGASAWQIDGSGYTGVANLIWAYLTVDNENISPSTSIEVFGANGYGGDLQWFHHIRAFGGSDAICPFSGRFNYIRTNPAVGIHVENVVKRITVDWCFFGPHPEASATILTYQRDAAPYQGAHLPVDNQPNDGKVMLIGLSDFDGYRADNLRVTLDHNHYYGSAARNPRVATARVHLMNCWIDHYGHRPGMADPAYMAVATDLTTTIGSSTVHGWSPSLLATLGAARWNYWPYPVWRQDEGDHKGYGYGSECRQDGELLAENTIYTGYNAGEQHTMSAAMVAAGFITAGQEWKVHDPGAPGLHAVQNHSANDPDPLVIARGCLLEGSAVFEGLTVIEGVGYSPSPYIAPFSAAIGQESAKHPLFRGWRNGHYNTSTNKYVNNSGFVWAQDDGSAYGDGGAGPDWGGVPPYSYALLDADATLKTDLTRGAGNVQPWNKL